MSKCILSTVLPPVLVPRNPQQITGPRYEPTRYANNQPQSQVYSPQSEGSPLTFDYPGMITIIIPDIIINSISERDKFVFSNEIMYNRKVLTDERTRFCLHGREWSY